MDKFLNLKQLMVLTKFINYYWNPTVDFNTFLVNKNNIM